MAEECLYAALFTSSEQRTRALDKWLHDYNHHRSHTALGLRPPISRVDNLTGQYS